ncbi:hypothetical protein [Brachyspira hyodysenteriae]|nr:hypothetical protein [Brachyspira hyodysenteriae]MCZ9943132.1 hypothetical protein [Brachyspira hyodysenteriae]
MKNIDNDDKIEKYIRDNTFIKNILMRIKNTLIMFFIMNASKTI